MTQPSLDSFFSGGGGRSVSWKDKPIGTTVAGTIEMVHPPQQATDPSDGSPKFKKNGDPIMQVRIDLATDLRNWEMCKPPDDPTEADDGRRSLYVGGWMTGAVGDALRKAGRKGAPEPGARLSVTLSERTPADRPGLNPTNKFTAEYSSPSSAATGAFFDTTAHQGGGGAANYGGGNGGAINSTPEPVKPDSISDAAWAQMDAATKAAVSKTMVGVNAGAPPF